jgi:3-deoxy-D-manno-octulosonic-acid transferase
MILFFYNLALLVALALTSPWWLWKMATAEKYRDIYKRLGRIPPALRRLPKDGVQPVLWIHAVSVGEVLAVARLVQELDAAIPPYRIVVSTTTRTGQALARQRFGADRVFYCPLDLLWAVARVMNSLEPKMLILAETEFWPNLLTTCYRRDVPVVVVNARISDRSWPRYRRLRGLWRPFLSRLSAVLAQSALDADRLRAIGCRPDAVSVAGNLKFDVRASHVSEATRILKEVGSGLNFLVAGSTLEGEEAALLAAWPALLRADSQLAMVLAPRHPDRFTAVASLLATSGFPWAQRSAWRGSDAREQIRPGQIVLLDTIGELASVYSLATVAFVGGSLVEAGGHNPLEPAQFAVPIVMGSHYANFRAITEDLLAHEAIRVATPDQLAATLADLLTDRVSAEAVGNRARQIFEQQSGATARCVAAIRKLLPDGAPVSHPEPVSLERRA